jgi:hypothetical protein
MGLLSRTIHERERAMPRLHALDAAAVAVAACKHSVLSYLATCSTQKANNCSWRACWTWFCSRLERSLVQLCKAAIQHALIYGCFWLRDSTQMVVDVLVQVTGRELGCA